MWKVFVNWLFEVLFQSVFSSVFSSEMSSKVPILISYCSD